MKHVILCDGIAAEKPTEIGIVNLPTVTSLKSESQPTARPQTVKLYNAMMSGSCVLVVAPDRDLRTQLCLAVESQGMEFLEAGTGSEALEIALRCRPQAVLLDMHVAAPHALEVIQRLREWSHAPILALSSRAETSEAVEVLDAGANDYIAKPFRLEEVLARLRAAQRFAPPSPPEIFKSGSLTVDLANRTVQVGTSSVNLSATEYSLLRLFVRHAGKVLTHAHILSEVWGSEMRDNVNYLRVYLRFLRRKLENPFEPSLFITQRAVGYGIAVRE